MFKKTLFALLLALSFSHAAEEPRAFYELLYSKSTKEDNNFTSMGVGVRFTYPVNDSFFLGYKGDATITNGTTNGFIYHLAFSTDVRLVNDLFLTGDFGHAWGYNSILDENGTQVGGYSDIPSAEGTYFTAGLRYQFSEYVEAAILYRNTLFEPVSGLGNILQEEILYSLNFAITEESLRFFAILFDNDN